jgi:xanthine dehydrogenase small subunit
MRGRIRFLLNGEPVVVEGLAPDTTLLDWLREHRGLTGTKEGCNEGDCGACTVSVARLEGGRPVRRAVNACIQLLPMLEGASVRTVEGVAGPSRLHPAQQAMVDLHGSQCGFCTPGFVMSLYAVYPEGRLEPAEINDVLAGNLCRCTGYGPIVAAAEAMHDAPAPEWEADETAALEALAHGETVVYEGGGRMCVIPATEDALAHVYAQHPDAVLVAGATDVGLWITKQLREPPVMIFLNRIKEFDRVVETEDAVEIGAGATYAQAEEALAGLAPDFGELIRRIGSVQVRNSGAVGGNVANGSPIGDTPPALIALGATMTLRRGDERREIAVEDFFVAYGKQDRAPGEFVESIRIPRPDDADRLRFYKVSKRFDQDITAVLGCFNIRVNDDHVAAARIAFGGMAATPKRAKEVEAALTGLPWTRETVEAALPAFARDFQPIDDMRASAAYRRRVAQNLLRGYFHESAAPLAETRLVGRGAA